MSYWKYLKFHFGIVIATAIIIAWAVTAYIEGFIVQSIIAAAVVFVHLAASLIDWYFKKRML